MIEKINRQDQDQLSVSLIFVIVMLKNTLYEQDPLYGALQELRFWSYNLLNTVALIKLPVAWKKRCIFSNKQFIVFPDIVCIKLQLLKNFVCVSNNSIINYFHPKDTDTSWKEIPSK